MLGIEYKDYLSKREVSTHIHIEVTTNSIQIEVYYLVTINYLLEMPTHRYSQNGKRWKDEICLYCLLQTSPL